MITNRFLHNPTKVIVFDPVKMAIRRSFCFLGDVSAAVVAAVERSASGSVAPDKLLKEQYGSSFAAKLGLGTDAEWHPSRQLQEEAEVVGGDSTGHESDLDEIAELLAEKPPSVLPGARPATEDLRVDFAPGVEYVTSVHIYPEDRFAELKDKIYLATNIPTYRQHLFYVLHGRIWTTYDITVSGFYPVNILRRADAAHSQRSTILGIHIDRYLYDKRGSCRVRANDVFRTLGETLLPNPIVYVVDLAQYTAPLRSQLIELCADTQQFEMLYYGFIIKFWPQLTPECFVDYVMREGELVHKYPDLARGRQMLRDVYRAEREIVDYNYRHITAALTFAGRHITTAVMQMTASVEPSAGTLLNIRNLFDQLRTNRCIPEIHAYIEVDNKPYLLRKHYVFNESDIQFPAGAQMKDGVTIAISLRRDDQDATQSRERRSRRTTVENEQSRYMFLNIRPNGRYLIRTMWNEEDELTFEDIVHTIKRFIDPIISRINTMSRYVFIVGTALQVVSKTNINYSGLSISVFWKRVLPDSAFKAVRAMWESYMRARITGPRNIQQFDKYEIMFRKGMHKFDTNVIERIVSASSNIILNNYYAYLSNNAVKQKWDQNYDGRIMRMSHRTTDICFEVDDIHEAEWKIFWIYIVSFIYKASRSDVISFKATEQRHFKKLRKLREQDPELFNLKKYGSKRVYSRLCQSQSQPFVYTADELSALPPGQVAKLIKYWNFTMNKPAWYGCPNKKYPHLSFIVGMHPKHYCLPCCNKKPRLHESSKKARVNTICLQKHKYIPQVSPADAMSRHVINYGKEIGPQRLSKMPSSSVKGLLFDTLESKLNYYLYGVQQHTPALDNCGALFAIATALALPVPTLVKKMTSLFVVSSSGADLFHTLLHGVLAEHFRSAQDLTDTMHELFVDAKTMSHAAAYQFKLWTELFVELSHLLNAPCFTFIDESGRGDVVDLYITGTLQNEITYISRLNETLAHALLRPQQYVILLRKQNSYYPMFAINPERYFRIGEITQRTYPHKHKLIKLLFSMAQHAAGHAPTTRQIDLSLVKEFAAFSHHEIVRKYINRHNMCYAVLLESGGAYVHFPIDYSAYMTVDGIEISFEAFSRDAQPLPLATLNKLIAELNDYISTHHPTHAHLVPHHYVDLGLVPIGVNCNGLIFYFNDAPAEAIDNSLPHKPAPADYEEINKLILQRVPAASDPRAEHIGAALYNNYLYQLFLLEFINYLDRERNVELRGRIVELITSTNFRKEAKKFAAALDTLLLKDHPADHLMLQDQITTFFFKHQTKEQLINLINNTVYNFDHVTMDRLRKMTREDIKVELTSIAARLSVRRDLDMKGLQFPNVYMPCGAGATSTPINAEQYCADGRLVINRPIEPFIDILAADLTNPLKSRYLLSGLWTDNCINPLQFTKHPTEVVTVYMRSDVI